MFLHITEVTVGVGLKVMHIKRWFLSLAFTHRDNSITELFHSKETQYKFKWFTNSDSGLKWFEAWNKVKNSGE